MGLLGKQPDLTEIKPKSAKALKRRRKRRGGVKARAICLWSRSRQSRERFCGGRMSQ